MSPAKARGTASLTVEETAASTIEFVSEQRAKRLDLRLLKHITHAALAELPGVTGWNLTFHLVGAKKMAAINETHLGHAGPTDVITFDYLENATRHAPRVLHGEIFICVPVAITQAREFQTDWQSEVIRYIVHALLHLCGYDDLNSTARRVMKRHENRIVQKLARQHRFTALGK
jgi:probable rRNA maturation factor